MAWIMKKLIALFDFQDKLSMNCVSNNQVSEFMRCIKSQVENLIPGFQESELSAMSLGLAHK